MSSPRHRARNRPKKTEKKQPLHWHVFVPQKYHQQIVPKPSNQKGNVSGRLKRVAFFFGILGIDNGIGRDLGHLQQSWIQEIQIHPQPQGVEFGRDWRGFLRFVLVFFRVFSSLCLRQVGKKWGVEKKLMILCFTCWRLTWKSKLGDGSFWWLNTLKTENKNVVSSSKSSERLTANKMWDIKVYHIGGMNKVDGS